LLNTIKRHVLPQAPSPTITSFFLIAAITLIFFFNDQQILLFHIQDLTTNSDILDFYVGLDIASNIEIINCQTLNIYEFIFLKVNNTQNTTNANLKFRSYDDLYAQKCLMLYKIILNKFP
jgi:hypothetical protein